MTFLETLRAARSLATRAGVGRGVAVFALGVVERVLAPAVLLAYMAGDRSDTLALACAAALGASSAAKGALQRRASVQAEAETHREVVDAVLRGDVLDPMLAADEDAQATLLEALHRTGVLLGETIPNFAASVVATIVFAVALPLLGGGRIAVVAAVAFGCGGALLVATRRWVDRAQEGAWRAWGELANGVADACDARLEIAASGTRDAFLERFGRLATQWEGLARRAARASSAMGRAPVLVVALAVGLGVVFEARQEGLEWSGALVRAGVIAASAPALVGIGIALQTITAGARRVRLIEEIVQRRLPARAMGEAPPGDPRTVSFRAVSFSYGAGNVLDDVSFEARRGEIVALAGVNGSGKSTCLRVVLGLGPTKSGQVLVGDAPIASLDLDAWRQMIAFLPQRPHLPARATIAECLRFLDHDVEEAAMGRALERVGLAAMLGRSDRELLAVRVGQLSAGARQRLAVARLLCRDAPIVVLDEPDANLDRAGTGLIVDLLREWAQTKIVLVAAHDPELLEAADRVVVLDAGRVAPRERAATAT